MELTIHTAVCHVLDAALDTPLLSGAALPLTDEALTLLSGALQKAYTGDETKACVLSEDSPVPALLQAAPEQLAQSSAPLAQAWFALLHEQPSIPAGDIIFAMCEIDGAPVLAALKLNYKSGYVHYFAETNGVPCNELVRQSAQLPSRADEAFFVRTDTQETRVLEKQYELDGRKGCYLAARLLRCKTGLSPKQKLSAIRAVAEEVNQKFYGNLGVEESDLAAAVCEEYHAAQDSQVPVAALCEKLYGDMPHAREAFTQALAERDIAPEEALPLSGAAVRRLEKQSLRSGAGVEVKVPVNLYKDATAVEFIHNEDGTTSLLIKNILM